MADGAEIFADDVRAGDPARRRRLIIRRTLSAGIAVVALAAFGSILVYAYHEGRERSADAAPVLLKPAAGPYKVRPESPGGMMVPDRDKEVYQAIAAKPAAKKVERLMPGPEQPIRRPRIEQAALMAADQFRAELAMAVPRDSGGKPVVPARKPAAKRRPIAAPQPVKVPPPDPKKAVGGRSSYRVQIASLRSKRAVDKAWKSLLRQHQDLLSRLNMSVQKADLGPAKGIYFRMQAGPFEDRASAREFCSRLASRKVGCFVVGR